MEDVSESGAKLSVEGLNLKEFFPALVVEGPGLSPRLPWVNGDQTGVIFVKRGDKRKQQQRRRAPPET